jgi:putative tryptophan/tyrosine transport system substrate-binding protein
MIRRTFVAGALALAAAPLAVRAQQQRPVPRIAYLSSSPPGDQSWLGFFEGLRDFGLVEGKDVVIEYFFAPTNTELPPLAAKAVASNPDLIVAVNNVGALAAKGMTKTIPIVFTSIVDPVAYGLVASLARPGGNLTGPTGMIVDTAAKRLKC